MFDRTERFALIVLGTFLLATAGLIAVRAIPGGDKAPPPASPDDGEAGVDVPSGRVPPLPREHVEVSVLTKRLDDSIKWHEDRVIAEPTSWLDLETVALAWMARADLGGRFADYATAEEALRRAFAIAPAGSGPLLVQAELDYTLHRLGNAERHLFRFASRPVPLTFEERAEVDGMLGDLAFQRGRYREAYQIYRNVWGRRQTMHDAYRLAQWHWRTGDFVRADAFLNEAQRRAGSDPEAVAWLLIQRGTIDLSRGRYEAARRSFASSAQLVRGWYLAEQHLAEVDALLGRDQDAIARLRRILETTDVPEVRDSLARLLRERGDTAAADEQIALAREAWNRMLGSYPEAAYGHAIDHWVDLESDPARAVQLAEENRNLRPNGEAMTKLARAYLAGGRTADARRTLEDILETEWRTAELHALAADIYWRDGDTRRAASERRAAAAINPRIFR